MDFEFSLVNIGENIGHVGDALRHDFALRNPISIRYVPDYRHMYLLGISILFKLLSYMLNSHHLYFRSHILAMLVKIERSEKKINYLFW